MLKTAKTLSLLALTLILAAQVQAEHYSTQGNQHTTYAKVIKTKPIYEAISYTTPQQSCHYEQRTLREHRSSTPIIVGSLIGGAIGNELGHNKTNKKVGALAGAILGGSIANDISHHQRGQRTTNERVCTTSHQRHHREELVGYRVIYQYNGRRYRTRTKHHPGDRIRVAVNVQPVGV